MHEHLVPRRLLYMRNRDDDIQKFTIHPIYHSIADMGNYFRRLMLRDLPLPLGRWDFTGKDPGCCDHEQSANPTIYADFCDIFRRTGQLV